MENEVPAPQRGDEEVNDREPAAAAAAAAAPALAGPARPTGPFVPLRLGREPGAPKCKNVVLYLLSLKHHTGMFLSLVSEELQGDYDVVLAAVSKSGLALKKASRTMRGNRDIVLAAVGQNGMALEFASKELRADREVVTTAINKAPFALQFASDDLRKDMRMVLACIHQDPMAFQCVSLDLIADPEFMDTVKPLIEAKEPLILRVSMLSGKTVLYVRDRRGDDDSVTRDEVVAECARKLGIPSSKVDLITLMKGDKILSKKTAPEWLLRPCEVHDVVCVVSERDASA
mmetsp:Transcript_39205/g.92301  ORF Transcript_39205/g.92301 Transcript_39205/m.92301 type:complete len:288 (-) Transcript_39205:19-882(-)